MKWLFTAALTVPSLAMARPPGPPKGPPPMAHVVERHAAEIGLDPEVQDAIEQIDREGRELARPLRDDLRSAHEALRAAMESDQPDRATVLARAAAVGDAEARLREHHLTEAMDILALLTVEQRRTLRSLRPERPPRH